MQAFKQKNNNSPHFFVKKVTIPNNYPQISCQKVAKNNHIHNRLNAQKPYYTWYNTYSLDFASKSTHFL